MHADLVMLVHIGMELAPASAEAGLLAGRLPARYCHRERMAVSLADCVAAPAALSTGSPMATADPSLARVIRAERGEIHALPDTAGGLP